MAEQSYIGIAANRRHEWVAALRREGNVEFSHPFGNTTAAVGSFVQFINDYCSRPRICIRPSSPTALRLIKSLSGIPDVEVVLLSDAGLRMHQAWLSETAASRSLREHEASLLALCAERII